VTQRYEPSFEIESELLYYEWDPGLFKFYMVEPFQIDGVWYDPSTRSNVGRLIVQCFEENHLCGLNCGFDSGADRETMYGECLSKAYRLRPGMVYYRADKFDTPIYGD
jgi:hypothetical protein